MTQQLSTDNANLDTGGSGQQARNNHSGHKKPREWIKPFELMNETVFANDSQVICLMTTLQAKEIHRANGNSASQDRQILARFVHRSTPSVVY